jgi:hypothetical protein
VLLVLDAEGHQQHHDGDQGRQHEAERSPPPLESLLGFGELLLPETSVGRRPHEGLVDVSALG